MSNQLAPIGGSKELAVETNIFVEYLAQYGLPADNIIANDTERAVISANLPKFIAALPNEEKRDARYLSKFVGASAIGLFDAALNYIWNEVVLNLRKKTSIYGIDLFFDAAVGGKNRELYKDEKDLAGLKDVVLLDTCKKLELISEVVYKKLLHILNMRNDVAASHPNVESIGGYELLGWLQTCVKDVLQDRPSESAIKIKAFIDNIKTADKPIDQATVQRLIQEIRQLSLPHVNNMVITIFGIFIDPNTTQVLKANIARIAPVIWDCCQESLKFKIGVIIDGFRTNLHQEKLKNGIEFLTIVDGRRYESLPARVSTLNDLVDRLEDARTGRDNYYNEPPIMSEILLFCKTTSDIPSEVSEKIIRTVLLCRIGRGYSYCDGVSPGGLPLYDKFLSLLDDDMIAKLVLMTFDPVVGARIYNAICFKHYESILTLLRTIAIAPRVQQILDYLLKDIKNAPTAYKDKVFVELIRPYN